MRRKRTGHAKIHKYQIERTSLRAICACAVGMWQRIDEEITGMRIGMEKAIFKHLLEITIHQALGDRFAAELQRLRGQHNR